jgi:Protein of unknown function, DUF547
VISELRESMSIIFGTHMTATESLDREAVRKSELYAKFTCAAAELQKVNLGTLTVSERACFFINLYNVMTMHAFCVSRFPSVGLAVHLGQLACIRVVCGCVEWLCIVSRCMRERERVV